MSLMDACSCIEYTKIDEMVSNVLRIAKNLGERANPIIVAKFNSSDEETQFMRLLHQEFSKDAEKPFFAGTSLLILQERGIPVLFSERQCRFVSPGNIARIMQLSGYLSQPGDIFALRKPSHPFIVACFSTHFNALYRVGINLVGLITFVDSDYNKTIMF